MPNCHLIFCEKRGQWAAACRVLSPPTGVAVVETRSLPAAQAALAMAPASLVAIHAATDIRAQVIDFLLSSSRMFPLARFAALIDAEDSASELLFREAGAIDVLASALDLPRLTDAVHRQSARTPSQKPSIYEFAEARMPWKGLATTLTR